MQLAISIGIAFVPALAFYFVYRKYSVFLPDYSSHILHFLIGAIGALVLVIVQESMPPPSGSWQTAFFRAALPERLLVLCGLLVSPALRSRTNSLSEKIAAGIVAGIGFATIENILYGLEHGFPILMPRLLMPLPLHAALGAFAAHWIGLYHLHRHSWMRSFSLLTAIVVPVAAHTIIDGFLFSGSSYLAGAVLLCFLIGLDYTMARVQLVPPQEVLSAMGMGYEEWKLVHDEAGYERWLMQEHGAGFRPEKLFKFRLSATRGTTVVVLLMVPVLHSLWISGLSSGLSTAEQRLVFTIFPLFLALNVAVIGQVNPGYFRHGQIRIPFKIRATIGETVDWASNVRLYGVFVRTVVPVDRDIETMRLSLDSVQVEIPAVRVSWENHENLKRLYGSVLTVTDTSVDFLRFIVRLWFRQLVAGIRYRARLPGFKDIAALFIQPETVGQDLRFFPAGTQLFREGEEGDTFFLVRKGKVAVYRELEGRKLPLAQLGPGDLFGEMAIAGHVPRNASAACETDCVLAVGERDSLDRLIRSNVQFARQLIEMAAMRFHDTQHKVGAALERLESKERWRKILEYAGLVLLLEGIGQTETIQVARTSGLLPDQPEVVQELLRALGRRAADPARISREARAAAWKLYRNRGLKIAWKAPE
jgi:CRP-like cAMP-binding protein/RsiW-degrading membrane proteinase PrsW (M82 family)